MILILIRFLASIALFRIPYVIIVYAVPANETDYRALLAFKGQIISDPIDALSSWNDSVHFCEWNGVTCGDNRSRVTGIELPFLRLVGSLTPHIGNLSFLRVLILHDNTLGGAIPEEIGRLSRLEQLVLANNSFGGEIPGNLSNCSNLQDIDLMWNNLEGQIPESLGSLWNLTKLGLSKNRLSGKIPASLGNLSSLTQLHLPGNHFEGSVPAELGKISRLVSFQLSSNNLSGPIPVSLYNISSLVQFAIIVNNVSGSLPSDLFLKLPNLGGFYLGVNNFSGPIPSSIANASRLSQIDISQNFFTGPVPSNLGGLTNLDVINLGGNPLGTEHGADDLRFLESLTNCTNLRIVWSQLNGFNGPLPNSIGNFSDKFTSLMLDWNLISGSLPSGIGNLVNLEMLSLYSNRISGPIPESIGKLSRLKTLVMDQNNLSGTIPTSLGNMTSLIELSLGNNNLQGSIPPSIGKCSGLNAINLGWNSLSGSIPEEIFGLSSLSMYLILSNNRLAGRIPSRVGNMINLIALDFSVNDLSDKLPSDLGSCRVLESLILKENRFHGTIPAALKNLRGLQSLDLSRNNLSGQIPGFLADLPLINYLNLSYNSFEGEVPNQRIFRNRSGASVAGNSNLCGGPPELRLPRCKIPPARGNKTRVWIIIVAVGLSIATAVLLVSIVIVRYRSRGAKPEIVANWTHHDLYLFYTKLSYRELLEATDGFDPSNVIGEGSFGVVYKRVLKDCEETVAVKVLKPDKFGAAKSFMAECEALRNIRHRNLVKTITACSSLDSEGKIFMALVFEYMPNGSLENWLHNESGGGELSLVQRLNIAVDVAEALHYLHRQCQVPIVHRDLKPSNVLLDSEFCAHLGDFGIAKFLKIEESAAVTSSIGIRGTIGYVAPEYGFGGEASTHGDVYSFGILLLELFTGKLPTGPMFGGNFSLREFVEQALLPDRLIMHAIDPMLGLGEVVEDNIRECLVSVLQVGLMCSTVSPNERIGIGEALLELHKARDLLTNLDL